MPQYMLLLYDDPQTWMKLSPQEIQKVIGKFQAWGQKAAKQGNSARQS